MKRTSRKGFTLIELIVTIVILGILAALAVPAFQAVIDRSRDNSLAQSANSIARELHALAAFEEGGDPDDELQTAKDAGDIPAGVTADVVDATTSTLIVVNNGEDRAPGTGESATEYLTVTNSHGTVKVFLGDKAGVYTPVTTVDVERAA